jgi:hypothetical protein
MKSTRLHLGGISSRRLILLPEERPADERSGRPRIRRYRLGILSGQDPSPARADAKRLRAQPPLRAQGI